MVSFTDPLSTTFALILVAIFAFLGGLHVYWAAGGRRWLAAAVPQVEGKQAINPGKGITLVVALGLFSFGLLALLLALPLKTDLPLLPVGWVVAGIFLLRAIGDFRYVGFFKRERSTIFGKRDTAIYSPLCLTIALLFTLLLTL